MKTKFPSIVLALGISTAILSPTQVKAMQPKLIVVVSVDQWKYEYFERFNANLDKRGIAHRTMESGIWVDNCFHQHAFTKTGPGHSVLMTGAYPNRSGIIENSWYEREAGKQMYCVFDDEARNIGTTASDKPVSPRNLLVDTVGDQLKMATGMRGKVFGVAIKDRAAILMAGRLADAAFWLSSDGKWITSDHYLDRLPGYIRNLNEERVPFRFEKKTWALLHPAGKYTHGKQEKSDHERPISGMSRDFPHHMPDADKKSYLKHVSCSPFGNDATLDAAREIVIHEQLGQDDVPDILAINLSSTDYVGHAFGPYSLEVEDMTYRTDKQLGQFSDFLSDQLNGAPWMMFLTADHGVAPIPERAADWGLRAKRDPLGRSDRVGNYPKERDKLEIALRDSLGLKANDTNGARLVQAVVDSQVFLNWDHPALRGETLELARRVTRDVLLQNSFIAHAATRDQLMQDCSTNEMLHMLQRSFHAKRSGDVLYVLKPYTFSGGAAATHGSPWQYDRHVPLMIFSSDAKLSAELPVQVSPSSIAPTISRILQIETPSACTERRLNIEASPHNN